MRVHFETRKIKSKMSLAAALAVDEVMALCVDDARSGHMESSNSKDSSIAYDPFKSHSGDLEASIMVKKPARPAYVRTEDGRFGGGFNGIEGRWGTDLYYGLYVEIGTSTDGPTAHMREEMGGENMHDIPVPIGPLMAARVTRATTPREEGFLRPAADRHYPKLAKKVKEHLARLA